MWKKICAVGATVLAFIVAAFIGGRLSNRRRVSGTPDPLREMDDTIRRVESGIDSVTERLCDSDARIDGIIERGDEASRIARRAAEILRGAEARSREKDRGGSSDSGT